MTQEKKSGGPLDLTGVEERGFAPLGVKALLDAAGFNNENQWQRSKEYFRQGVLVPRSALSVDTVEKRIERIAQCYPVVDSRKALAVVVHQKALGHGDYAFRGDHLIGDDHDIARFWARLWLQNVLVSGWNIGCEAMCWTAMAPETVCVPYVDVDEYDFADGFSRVWSTRVVPMIRAINQAFSDIGVTVERCPVYLSVRPCSTGPLTKFSFHVHWPDFGAETPAAWKKFLLAIEDIPRKREWVESDGKMVHRPATPPGPLFDPAVYTGRRQLFRGPYCGKSGVDSAVMRPVRVVAGETSGTYQYVYQDSTDEDVIAKAIFKARIAAFRSEVAMVDFNAYSGHVSLASRLDAVPLAAPVADDLESAAPDLSVSRVIRFCMPLFERCVLPEWQKFRYELMMAIGGGGGAVVPTNALQIVHDKTASRKGRVFFSVQGDSFCERDAAHVHTANPGRIGFVVNFLKCTIRQTCHVCGPDVKFPEYAFLHAGNVVRIEPLSRCGHSRVTCWTKSPSPYHLLLDYFREDFVFQRLVGLLWVYDADRRVWQSGAGANMVVGRLVDTLNRKHDEYLSAQRRCLIEAQLWHYDHADSKGEDEEEEDQEGDVEAKRPTSRAAAVTKYEAMARKFIKENTPLLHFTPQARFKLMLDLRGYPIFVEVAQMNVYPNLVAMKNLQYIDVLTGATGDMERLHYFTHVVNAVYNPEDAHIDAILGWFDEISTGDTEKALYLKWLAAYCFTFMMHDRKYILLTGTGKNAKGMFKEFILNVCTGPDGYNSRFKNLTQQFWAKSGNANTGAEAASPHTFELRNKTFLYTDDIAMVQLDTTKLKSFVAGEKQTCRGLYGDPAEIQPRGKILHTSNFDPSGPGEDQAYWERVVVVRMRTKYVEDASQVNHAHYRFLKDHARYERFLAMLDAFFTVTMRELVRYYKQVMLDGGVFGSFPLPADVLVANKEAKEKRLPLAAFMNQTTRDTDQPLYYCRLDDLFKNYLVFLTNANETRIARETTIGKFRELLAMALDVHVVDQPDGALVEGKRLVTNVRVEESGPGHYQYTGYADARGQKRSYTEFVGENKQ